jgi:hypothetical protein
MSGSITVLPMRAPTLDLDARLHNSLDRLYRPASLRMAPVFEHFIETCSAEPLQQETV